MKNVTIAISDDKYRMLQLLAQLNNVSIDTVVEKSVSIYYLLVHEVLTNKSKVFIEKSNKTIHNVIFVNLFGNV